MSKASELEAARLAAERNDARCKAITRTTRNAGLEGGEIPEVLADVAAQLLAEATYISEQRKSGWKSRSDAHTAAGRILEQWAKDLAAYLETDKPPARPPIDLSDPVQRKAPDGTPSARGLMDIAAGSNSGICRVEYPRKAGDRSRIVQCGKPAEHDGKHAEWIEDETLLGGGDWGPEWDAESSGWPETMGFHLGSDLLTNVMPDGPLKPVDWPEDGPITPDAATRVRLAIEASQVVHITAAPANYAWCDATEGTRGDIDAANCPDCIARFDAWKEADALRPKTVHDVEPTPHGSLKPMEENMVRHPDGRFMGVASFAVQPDTLAGIQIHLHGQHFVAQPSERRSGQSGILVVNYTIRDGGAIDITSIGFTPDPPLSFADESVALSAQPVAAIPQFSEPGPAPARQLQKRMTFEAVRQHGMARARGADHRSYSQVTAFAECSVRYALSDLDAAPAWWNVGGTALHYAVETINRHIAAIQHVVTDPERIADVPVLWNGMLGRAISEAVKESGVTPDRWRAAKKGAEGYDWWRINGQAMVDRWINRLRALYDDGWTIAMINGQPAVELSVPMMIETFAGAPAMMPTGINVENILDLVLVKGDTFLIIDFKSGASAPDSTYQLGQYGWALAGAIDPWTDQDAGAQTTFSILGAYWLARSDMLSPVDVSKSDTATDLRDLHPWSEIEYLITTMHAAESQGLYLPNRTRWCGSCGVAGLCPVGPS